MTEVERLSITKAAQRFPLPVSSPANERYVSRKDSLRETGKNKGTAWLRNKLTDADLPGM